MVLVNALRLGYARGLRSNREREIVSFERFRAGGSTTVRGYRDRSLGPLDDELSNTHRGDVVVHLQRRAAVSSLQPRRWGAVSLTPGMCGITWMLSTPIRYIPRSGWGCGWTRRWDRCVLIMACHWSATCRRRSISGWGRRFEGERLGEITPEN